jgi:hypothetical protein
VLAEKKSSSSAHRKKSYASSIRSSAAFPRWSRQARHGSADTRYTRKAMENRSHALIAGFFTIALLILAIFIVIWLGRDKIQRTPYEIDHNQRSPASTCKRLSATKGLKSAM